MRPRNFAVALAARTLNKGSGQQELKPHWIVVLACLITICKYGFAKMFCLVLEKVRKTAKPQINILLYIVLLQ